LFCVVRSKMVQDTATKIMYAFWVIYQEKKSNKFRETKLKPGLHSKTTWGYTLKKESTFPFSCHIKKTISIWSTIVSFD
jgi:hypothetical protein